LKVYSSSLPYRARIKGTKNKTSYPLELDTVSEIPTSQRPTAEVYALQAVVVHH
jgi:hypothetical protein